MRRLSVIGIALLAALSAGAQEPLTLTLDRALARAREAGPAARIARLRIEESRARLRGASLVLPSNPVVESEAGRRSDDGVASNDYAIALTQELELPARRRARHDAARAAVAQEEAQAREAERAMLRDVAVVFFRAAEAGDRADLAATAAALAGETLEIAARRFAAGDVAKIDVNVARTAAARAEAELQASRAAVEKHLAELRILLAIDASQPLRIDSGRYDLPVIDAAAVVARIPSRPEIALLDAAIAEAEAEARLARTLGWPELAVGGGWEREEGDTIVSGGVAFSLPLFDRGQEARTVATARLSRLHAEREARVRAAEAEARGAAAGYAKLREAAVAFENDVLPLLAESETLALESYAAGEISLAELILIRREALEARRAFIERIIETRIAAVELQSRAGVLQ